MLSINGVSDADYYLRTQGSGCGSGPGADGATADYYTDAPGEPPGEWYYVYRNDLGVSGEIHAEQPSGEAFRTVLNELRHPITGEQLGRAPQHFRSAEEKLEAWLRKNPDAIEEEISAAKVRFESHSAHAKRGWDMTFSVVKSISVAHAALEHDGRHDEANEVVAAMRAGIEAAMKMAADEFGITRRGAAGPDIDGKTTMRHVHDPNLQSAIFVHHTSRDRDPQLHAHVMVLNRILCEDEQWRALFASGLLKSKHQLDAVFTRVMEAELTRRLGWRFAMRPDGVAREVAGVSPEVRDLFSARSRALSEKAQELLDVYTAVKGEPSTLVRWRLQQQAVKESRPDKPKAGDTPTREQDVARWDREIAKEFHEGFVGVLDELDVAARTLPGCPEFDPDVVIAQALAHLTEHKGNDFSRSHLMFAIDRFLPDMPGLDDEAVVALLRELTDAAVEGREVVSMAAPALVAVPASLIDSQTGESVFEPPRGGRFTTRTHLSREDWLVGLLKRHGAPVLHEETACRVLSERGLSDEQRRVAASILTSNLSVQIVNAAAGTGKSRLMAALSDASNDVWGHGLTGFTASENAAKVLAREGVHQAHNISAFLTFRARERRGEATDMERAKFAVPEHGTIVVDEASMVSTPQAVALMQELFDLNVGRVVFIGDTAQVDAVDAGGGFALLTQHREAHTLTQVRRFVNEWEREASAQLRDGDIEALTAYDKRRRIRSGTPEDIDRQVVQAFVDDHLSGLETVVVVSTGEKAAELSSQIRRRLVAAGRVRAEGVAVKGRNVAGVGDLVQTRLNHRKLDVVNREVWRVEETDLDGGSVTVRRAERDEQDRLVWGERRTIPADYVREQVELAYASTVEAVQGRTTDTSHPVIDQQMGISRAYPAVTRGQRRNTMWVPIERPARRHRESDEDYEARISSAMSAVVAAFEREDHTEAARTIIAAEQERATNLGHLGPQWQQLVAEHREVDHRQVLREVVGTDRHALFADLSLDGLLHLMRSAESHGYDVRDVVERAYGDARLEGARSPASLLYARLDALLHRRDVQPTRESVAAESYAERTPPGPGEEIGYAREVAGVMDTRVAELGERAEVEPPSWAQALLGGVPADIVDRGQWREKVGVVAAYREQYGWRNTVDPVGPAPSRAEPEKRWAWLRASRALGVDTERDVVTASDGDLANRVLTWRREQDQMPRNVDDDLREANDAASYARGRIVEAQNRGEDPSQWKRMNQELEARIGRLDKVDAGRKAAVELTAEPRDRAQEAMVEMRRRVERDRVVAEREAAKRAADERDRQAAADEDARVHGAVGERFREQWVPNAPTFGSERWAELDDDAPAKRASLFTAALSWWRMGEPRDERVLTERLERTGADVAPERAMPEKALERVRGGEDEEQVRRDYPTGDLRVLGEVHRYTGRDMEGEAPAFGTPEYADAAPGVKAKSETRAGLTYHHAGDTLDERERRAEVEEERAGAREIAEDLKTEREQRVDRRTHRELAKARGEEVPEREPVEEEPVTRDEPEPPARPDTSWVREAAKAKVPEREPEPERAEPKVEPESRQEPPDPTPTRDDLDEQLDRARAAEERIRADRERVEGERRDNDRRETDRREQVRSRDAEGMQR